MKYKPRRVWPACVFAAAALVAAGLRLLAQAGEAPDKAIVASQDESDVRGGREIWFNATFGDEKYYALPAQLPDPTERILIGFINVLLTPRASRFERLAIEDTA